MSRIVAFLQALHGSGADRLVLASGKPAALTVGGTAEALSADPLGSEEIESLLREIWPEDAGGRDVAGRHEFRYSGPEGEVNVTVRRTERFVQAIVVPRPEAAPRAGEPDPAAMNGATLTDDEPGAPAGNGMPPAGSFEWAEVEEGDEWAEADERDEWAEVEEPLAGRDEGDETAETVGPQAAERETGRTPPGPRAVDPAPAARAEPADAPEFIPDPEPPPRVEAVPGPPALELRDDAPAMERLFLKMVQNGCSDLHVSSGSVPLFRKDGSIVDLGGEPRLSATQAEALLFGITPDRYRKQFEERNDTDFAYEIPGVARFRCNLFRDRKGVGGVFRTIPAEILTAEQLGLPEHLLRLCHLRKGLALVTGPTGSGKSTTLAALVDYINDARSGHMITIEDPIEFVHDNKSCLINQREVGEHTKGFDVALRAALREDPDIVLVGELRDLETVEIALETAETGHLVFGTLHTNTAPGTVSRLIDQFPPGQQAQIRTMLADTLKAVIAQTLCRKKEGGRVAAMEFLIVNNAVANLIREDKTYQIRSTMQTGRSVGMVTLNDSLMDLVQRDLVTPTEAYRHSVDKSEFLNILERNGMPFDPSRLEREVA